MTIVMREMTTMMESIVRARTRMSAVVMVMNMRRKKLIRMAVLRIQTTLTHSTTRRIK